MGSGSEVAIVLMSLSSGWCELEGCGVVLSSETAAEELKDEAKLRLDGEASAAALLASSFSSAVTLLVTLLERARVILALVRRGSRADCCFLPRLAEAFTACRARLSLRSASLLRNSGN